MNSKIKKYARQLHEPNFPSSYKENDVVMMFTEVIEDMEIEKKEKEQLIQSGVHYSEMLPTESIPTIPIDTFKSLINDKSMMKRLAFEVGILAERIDRHHFLKGQYKIALVSLARAGTPVGVLLKRYFRKKYNVDIPHYSLSILRDKGIDFNALAYIINQEGHDAIQFIDGWTGKGVIQSTLTKSVNEFNEKFGTQIESEIACLYDPAHITTLCATHEDRLLPSAIYNSTVSGLMSRTIHREDLLSPKDYHGAKVYKHLRDYDVSELFIDEVSNYLAPIRDTSPLSESEPIISSAWHEVKAIKEKFGYKNINNVKPSIGETTRVLIRRYPERVLVQDLHDPDIKFVVELAQQQGVPVQEYPTLSHYKAVGMIKEL